MPAAPAEPPPHPTPPIPTVPFFSSPPLLRYGLVRVRENAESIAFYGGEDNEQRFLSRRLRAAIDNFGELLVASRNLNFFTSFYRWVNVGSSCLLGCPHVCGGPAGAGFRAAPGQLRYSQAMSMAVGGQGHR